MSRAEDLRTHRQNQKDKKIEEKWKQEKELIEYYKQFHERVRPESWDPMWLPIAGIKNTNSPYYKIKPNRQMQLAIVEAELKTNILED